MTFPETPLPIQVDLMVDGAWSDITSDVYGRDSITITRGRSAEGSTVDYGRCSLTLANRDAKYSPRVPTSANYGKIGRNTPLRVSVHAGTPYLAIPGGSADRATTPSTSAIDITSDLDVRVEARFDDWTDSGDVSPNPLEVAGRYGTAGSRSWLLTLWRGTPLLYWSSDGTAVMSWVAAAEFTVPRSGRMAIRATLDVNNGAGGHTITYYTAPTIAGPWTQLGTPIVKVGITTQIFNSAVPLDIGAVGSVTFPSAVGEIYAVEVRNGINGSVVANPDFEAQTASATSFTDSAGRSWSVVNNAKIDNRQTRFTGEVSEWPLKWDPSGTDIYVTIEAAGILRRLGKGAVALDSTLRRRIPTAANVLAYWPMEEGTDATRAYSPIPGVRPLTLSNVDWAANDTLPSSGPLPVLASNNGVLPMMAGSVPAPANSATGWLVQWIYRCDTPNTILYTFLRISSTGTVAEWYLQQRDNESRIYGIDGEGVTIVDQLVATSLDLYNQWTSTRFSLSQSGGTVTWQIIWQDVGGDAGAFSGTYSGTVGRVRGVASPPDGYAAALDGMAIGHIAVFSTAATTAYDGAITAYAGETAGTRMLRLADEEIVPVGVDGAPATEEPLGAQRPATLLSLLQEAADADHGILYEDRDRIALAYRGRETLYNQTPVQLTYTDLMPGLEPVDDDQTTQNDVTVTRINGSFGRATLADGPLSVNPPPAGVGTYASSESLSLYADEQAAPQAQWLMHLGTVDEPRYPVVNLSLARNPELIDRTMALDSGARLQILAPPAKLPPGAIDLLVQGYTEILSQYVWDMTLNCTPGSPWTVGVYDDPVLGRYGSSGSVLAAAVTSSATTLPVTATDGTLWITTAAFASHFPFDVAVGGERMTVTGITPPVVDAFGRTTSSGWGTADSGQAWTSTGGTAANFAVSGSQGRHTLTTTNTARFSVLDSGFADCDITVLAGAISLSTGASQFACVLGRYTDGSNHYYARLEFAVSGALTLSLRTRIGGVDTELGSAVLPFTHVTGRPYGMRFQVTGTTLRAKGWDSTASPEDVGWNLTATDTALATGTLTGVRSILSTANTNSSPVITYGNFTDQAPQIFTVVRHVNGVTKSQAAGTALTLFQPTVYAL